MGTNVMTLGADGRYYLTYQTNVVNRILTGVGLRHFDVTFVDGQERRHPDNPAATIRYAFDATVTGGPTPDEIAASETPSGVVACIADYRGRLTEYADVALYQLRRVEVAEVVRRAIVDVNLTDDCSDLWPARPDAPGEILTIMGGPCATVDGRVWHSCRYRDDEYRSASADVDWSTVLSVLDAVRGAMGDPLDAMVPLDVARLVASHAAAWYLVHRVYV